nr:hypothetical protein [Bacteroides intestinalis]
MVINKIQMISFLNEHKGLTFTIPIWNGQKQAGVSNFTYTPFLSTYTTL